MAEPRRTQPLVDYGALPSQALVLACLDTGDTLAWQEFVRRFQKLIATIVFRTSARWGESTPQVMDELIQETYLKLCTDNCRLLRSFQSPHDDAIFGYIKVLTANLVHDHFKASRAEKRGGSVVAESIDTGLTGSRVGQPDQSSLVVENKVLIGEIAACLEAATEGPNAKRDCRIFWLYYRAGLTARAIAALPKIGLGTKGVETTILRLTRLVRKQLTRKSEPEGSSSKSEGIRSAESL
jgi:RNA polymerase sigma-70 factor (ECF subfamily)